MKRGGFLAAACLLLPALTLAQQAGPAPEGDVAVPMTSPTLLSEDIPARLGRLGEGEVPTREVAERVRGAGAVLWIREALAPLEQPECRKVLEARGIALPEDQRRWSAAFPAGRPIAPAPLAGELLLPERLAPQGEQELSVLRATGLLPFEIALSGEWARAVAARHLGPPMRDAGLRASRGARLEGVARLAGILVALQGSGLDPAILGASLMKTDKDRAGLARQATLAAAANPVERALLAGYFEDGLGWATYHYLRAGLEGLIAALERPAVSLAELHRPGMRRRAPEGLPSGCSLGPRGAIALLAGDERESWASGVIADRFVVTNEGSVRGILALEDEHAAARLLVSLRAAGLVATRAGTRIEVALTIAEPMR